MNAFNSLTLLDIGFCKLITDKSLKTVAESFQTLHQLRMGWLPEITDDGVNSIAENCIELRFSRFYQAYIGQTDKFFADGILYLIILGAFLVFLMSL